MVDVRGSALSHPLDSENSLYSLILGLFRHFETVTNKYKNMDKIAQILE